MSSLHLVSFLVRCLHVVSVAIVLGGTVVVGGIATMEADAGVARVVLPMLGRYERLFWIALGVIAMTGVGNLGAFGAALPHAESLWGRRLTLKLSLALALVVLSLLRTALIARLLTAGGLPSRAGWRIVRRLYELTAVTVASVLVVALALAHG